MLTISHDTQDILLYCFLNLFVQITRFCSNCFKNLLVSSSIRLPFESNLFCAKFTITSGMFIGYIFIVTEITPFKDFYIAEDYHKNYYEGHRDAPYCNFVIDPKMHKLFAICDRDCTQLRLVYAL